MSDIVSPVQNISYTNKDFVRVYEELLDLAKELSSKWDPSISNESDPGVILLKLNAVIADKCNYNIDKSVLECFPLSVTQLPNARQLFDQLGYRMHWRKSAVSTVLINWIGSTTYSDEYAVINPFTMITDVDSSIIYTLLGLYDGVNDYNVSTMKLLCDGASSSAIKCNIIQGVPIDFTVSGNKLITIANLDENNRLYFPDTYVAENGVFITNADGSDNYNRWERKDNLSIENFGNYYYRFDINKDGTNCYIEFPEDVETLFGEGIYIKYIRTDSEYGNINASFLSKFYDTITANLGGENIVLNTDVISITNPGAVSNGSSYETINDAYRNYKRTVGTFHTLVTLRDYINAIINSGLVSNCFVCDRTNDIQTTYDVLTSVNNVDQKITYIEEQEETITVDHDGEDVEVVQKTKLMDAFSLKLYLLNYSATTTNSTSYMNTFKMATEKDTTMLNVKNYIDSEKCIVHDYSELLDPGDIHPHVAYFRNIYPIECTITAQTVLNNQQKAEIRNNIIEALRDNLSAKQVEFGEAIAYDLVYNIISNADPRIKYVSLFNINYSTQAVYYDSDSKLTYIYDDTTHTGAWYDDEFTQVNPLNYNLTVINPVNGATLTLPPSFKSEFINGELYDDIYFCSTKFINSIGEQESKIKYVPVNQRDEDNITDVEVDPVVFYNKVGLENCYQKQLFTCDSVSHNYGWYVGEQKVNLSDFGITYTSTPDVGDKITVSFSKSVSNPAIVAAGTDVTGGAVDATTFNSYVASMFPSADGNLVFIYKDENSITAVWSHNGVTVDLSEYGISINPSVTIDEKDQFKVKLSYGHQVKYDVIAKSILVGSTPFYIKDETFDYRLNQIAHLPIIENIAKVCGDVSISFTPQNNTYKLRDNESLQLYAPNLIELTSYSNYVKFEYYITQNIPSNSSYQLRNNEFIIFYWTESDNNAGVVYKYHCYGNDTIINPTFAMSLKTINDKNDTIAVKYNLIKYDLQGNTVESSWVTTSEMSQAASTEIANMSSASNILSKSKSVKIKVENKFTITRTSQYYLYWVLNDITVDSFKQNKYTLFARNQPSRMLGAGEYLIYTDSYKKNYEVLGEGTLLSRDITKSSNEWSVNAIDASDVLLNGIAVIEGNWFTLGDNDELSVTENAFTNIGSGCSLNIVAKDPVTNFYTSSISSTPSDLVTAFQPDLWYKEYISAGEYTLVYNSSNEWILNGDTDHPLTDLSTVGITLNTDTPSENDEIEISVIYSYKLTFNKDGYSLKIPEDGSESTTMHLSDFEIKYLLAGQDPSSGNWVTVDNVTLNGTIGWNGRSLLSLDFSSNTPQYILSNQRIHLINSANETVEDIVGGNPTYYIDKSGTFLANVSNSCTVDSDVWNVKMPLAGEYTYTYSSSDTSWKYNDDEVDLTEFGITLTGSPSNGQTLIITNRAPSHYPMVIMGSQDVSSYGTDYVPTFTYEFNDSGDLEYEYLSIYAFTELQSIVGEVVYTSTGAVAVTFNPEDPSREIKFRIPQGTYILPVKNNIQGLESLKVELDGTALEVMYANEAKPGVDYSELSKDGIHYLKMVLDNDNEHTLTILMSGHTVQSTILLDNCYKYVKPTQFGRSNKIMSDAEFNEIEMLMTYLDNLHVFKYDNVVNVTDQIADPVAASSFNLVNHICNPFTICEFSTAIIN